MSTLPPRMGTTTSNQPRCMVTVTWPRPWWRRLLHLPAKTKTTGPYTVEPWPWQ
jgi:hypothetical protein